MGRFYMLLHDLLCLSFLTWKMEKRVFMSSLLEFFRSPPKSAWIGVPFPDSQEL